MNYKKNTQVHAIKPLSLDKLGFYYLDLTETLADYTNSGYGEFDSEGIPKMGKGDKAYYNQVVIMNYGFALHTEVLRLINVEGNKKKLKKIINWLDQNKTEIDNYVIWKSQTPYARYGLKSGLALGITQGKAISFYLRMYELFDNNDYLETAKKAYRFLKLNKDQGGVRRIDENGYLWFEEYPSETPSYVLNGFVYAVFGIYDAYKLNIDAQAEEDYLSCLKTLNDNIHKYDSGYWSYYCQFLKELVMVYYQKNVHVPQMMAMYFISGNTLYKDYSNKWKKQINPLNILFVKLMYRIRYRFKFLFS